MIKLTEDELRREPLRLIHCAERGESMLVSLGSTALLMTVPLMDGSPAPGALMDLAAALYEREQISLGRAAEIAGLSYGEMMDELARRGVPTLRLQPGELERELATFGP